MRLCVKFTLFQSTSLGLYSHERIKVHSLGLSGSRDASERAIYNTCGSMYPSITCDVYFKRVALAWALPGGSRIPSGNYYILMKVDNFK